MNQPVVYDNAKYHFKSVEEHAGRDKRDGGKASSNDPPKRPWRRRILSWKSR